MMNALTAIVIITTMSQLGCTFTKSPIKTTHKYEPKMKFIKGGYVVINKNKPANLKNNKVKVNSFWIAETETSYKQWENCFKEGGCKKDKYLPNVVYDKKSRSHYNNHPVTYVNWYEANEYTRWLSKISGKKYRLPTEAEWLFAARAGKTTRYPWGNTAGKNKANCQLCDSGWDGTSTAPVGSFKPYGGLYDMYGNVMEWTCSSASAEEAPYPSGNETICANPTYTQPVILLGGNFETYKDRLDHRFKLKPSSSWGDEVAGFRVIREGVIKTERK